MLASISISRCLQRPNHLMRERFYLLAPAIERSAWTHDEFCRARGYIGLDFCTHLIGISKGGEFGHRHIGARANCASAKLESFFLVRREVKRDQYAIMIFGNLAGSFSRVSSNRFYPRVDFHPPHPRD